MITQDQLKDILDRTEKLHHYLNIPQKQMEFEEEQLRTQAPDFWDDVKRAQEQMKKVKGIEAWLKDYKAVRTAADELQLAFDFYRDEMVTEQEVDANYAQAVKLILKKYHLHSPLFYLPLSAGHRPCRQAEKTKHL